MVNNTRTVTNVICDGLCHGFPIEPFAGVLKNGDGWLNHDNTFCYGFSDGFKPSGIRSLICLYVHLQRVKTMTKDL